VTQRPAAADGDGPGGEAAGIRVRLDEMLARRGMTLTELSARVDVTIVNLSVLKNGRARAIRFSTMARLCEALQCQPGDLLSYQPQPAGTPGAPAGTIAQPAGTPADGRRSRAPARRDAR